jgi:hypothetical protein
MQMQQQQNMQRLPKYMAPPSKIWCDTTIPPPIIPSLTAVAQAEVQALAKHHNDLANTYALTAFHYAVGTYVSLVNTQTSEAQKLRILTAIGEHNVPLKEAVLAALTATAMQ